MRSFVHRASGNVGSFRHLRIPQIYTFTQLIYASAIPQSILRITQFRKI